MAESSRKIEDPVEARAYDLASQINEKMAKLNAKDATEQTEAELDEIAKLYKDIEALYESAELETIEDRSEWLKEFEKKSLFEIDAIATKYPNNVKLKDIVKNLCGFDSDEAWKWRELAWASGTEQDLKSTLEGLAGVDSEKAWKMRDYTLLVEKQLDSLAISLAGLDSKRAWEMREAILAKDPFLVNSIAWGLAGVDSEKAWGFRNRFINNKNSHDGIARGLAGINSPEAWKMREALLEWDTPHINALAESLAGIDSQKAWEMREKLMQLRTTSIGNLSMSLAGLDSEKAWKMRDDLLKMNGGSTNTAPLVVGLPGVDSKRAWDERNELLEKNPDAARVVIESLAGNHTTFVWQLNKENGKPERQMEFDDLYEEEKTHVTPELEKFGLKVGQKLKLNDAKREDMKRVDAQMEEVMGKAKELTIVGFTVDDRIVIQLDKGATTFTYPGETFQEFYEITQTETHAR